MAHTKSGGSTKNARDSQPKYLGVKLYEGQHAKPGSILVRQRGTKILAGRNVRIGRDHTLFAVLAGIVKFSKKRKIRFDGPKRIAKVVNVDP